MAAIGPGWVDGAWVEAGWIAGAWSSLVAAIGLSAAQRVYKQLFAGLGKMAGK